MQPLITRLIFAARETAAAVGRFVTGMGLPLLLLTITVIYQVFLFAVLITPADSGPWAQFATDFKLWCFRYDPRTESVRWAAVVIMFLEPLFITAIVVFMWRGVLRGALSLKVLASQWRTITAGALVAALIIGGMFAGSAAEQRDVAELPFPGERIRTRIEPPAFALYDHRGNPVALEELRGTAVLITGVYARCSISCPHILIETRTLLNDLPQKAIDNLSIVALSLNPENEDTELMSAVASTYNLPYPTFRYLNGDPETMAELLKRFQFSPRMNPETGVIDHANLFILIDGDGYIAYRFNLDPRHTSWLRQAVLELTSEAAVQAAAPTETAASALPRPMPSGTGES